MMACFGSVASLRGAEPVVDFNRDVFPILRRSCFECHGEKLQKGDLRLDEQSAAMASTGLIVPRKPEESELVRRVTLPKGHDEVMPSRGDPLPPRDIERTKEWTNPKVPGSIQFKGPEMTLTRIIHTEQSVGWQLDFEQLGIKLGEQVVTLVDSMRTAPYPNAIFSMCRLQRSVCSLFAR